MVLGIALDELKTWNQIKYVAPKREHVLWNSKYEMSALITPPVRGLWDALEAQAELTWRYLRFPVSMEFPAHGSALREMRGKWI